MVLIQEQAHVYELSQRAIRKAATKFTYTW